MSGHISLEQHRRWVAELTLPTPTVTVDMVPRMAEALKVSETELVRGVITDLKYSILEHARVIGWAREALTLAFLEADRIGRLGGYYTDGVFFHVVARRFSPTYIAALERGLRGPREMKRLTIIEARQELMALGLRLQKIRDAAKGAAARWYHVISTKKGRILKPRRGVHLDIARAQIGLPPVVRNPSWVYLGDAVPPQAYLRIETEDEVVRSVMDGQAKMGIRIPPIGLENYTLVNDATILGEQEYEPVRSGPRSRRVMQILSDTILLLDVDAVRAERARLQAALEVARQRIAAEIVDHGRVVHIVRKTTFWKKGESTKLIRTTERRNGVLFSVTKAVIPLKHPAKLTDRKPGKKQRWKSWKVKWTAEEHKLIHDKRALEQKIHALDVIAERLEGRHEVAIRTRMHQAINRRWHASSFWPEHVEGDRDQSSVLREYVPESIDHEGEVTEGAGTRITQVRGRLFSVYRQGERNVFPRERLCGVDVSSSQWQILSVFLHDSKLEEALQKHSMAEIVGPRVWPELPPETAAKKAKDPLMQLGYGAREGRVEYRNAMKPGDMQKFLNAISPQVLRLHRYAKQIARGVEETTGFRFTDPYDLSEVIWQPMRTRQESVDSDSLQILTDVPTRLDRQRLARQIPPMLTHTMDSMFSGMVIERLHARGVVDIVALFDSWLIPERYLQRNENLFDEVLGEAAIEWMQSLGLVYDALLQHDVPDRAWMLEQKVAWERRAWRAENAPTFRTKLVTLDTWE
jgi:hypothetical protein